MEGALARPHVLVVEDDADLSNVLGHALGQGGFVATRVPSGDAALARVRSGAPVDLVLLDFVLPGLSGPECLAAMRALPTLRHTPMLMLTARTAEADRVAAFEAGADDYVTKPFSARELVLRMRALLRRTGAPRLAPAETRMHLGLLAIDTAAHQVWVEGREVTLTALEFRLLATLVERRGRVQTRTMLLDDVWGVDPSLTTRTVDTHVKRLREKLERAAAYVETIRGVGYRLRAEPVPNG